MQGVIQRASVPNATAWSVALTYDNDSSNTSNENSKQDSNSLNDVSRNNTISARLLYSPADASMYFDALLRDKISSNHLSIMSVGGIIGLLALPSHYFRFLRENDYLMIMGSESNDHVTRKTLADQAHLYLKAVSKHCNVIYECWQAHNQTDSPNQSSTLGESNNPNSICDMVPIQYIVEIFEAVSCCASICHDHSNRAHISSSGILNTLAKLATGEELSNILLNQRHDNMQSDEGNNNHCINHDSANISSPPNKKTNRNSFMNANGCSPSTTKIDTSNKCVKENDINKHVLNVAHTIFLQCCILASQYHLAAKFVKFYPIYDLPKYYPVNHNGNNHTMMSSCETFLLYFYYLGMVHIGNNNDYRAAISAFQICISAVPAKEISAIVIAAYKKYLLCQCCLTAQDLEDDDLFFDDYDIVHSNVNNAQKNESMDNFPHDSENSKLRATSELQKNDKSRSSNDCSSQIILNDYPKEKDRKRIKLFRPLPLQGTLDSKILKIPDFLCVEVNCFFAEAATSQYRKDYNKLASNSQRGNSDLNNGCNNIPMIDAQQKTECQKPDREKLEKNYHGLPHYQDLVASFCTFELSSFNTILNRDKSLLEVDGNFGLAKQLENTMKRIIVRRLANIYSVIKLETLAQSLALYDDNNGLAIKKAEQVLLELAWRDQEHESQVDLLKCLLSVPFEFHIDVEKSLVYFPKEEDGDVESNNCNIFHQRNMEHLQLLLTGRIMSVMSLADRVKHLDTSLVTSARYQTVVSKDLNNNNSAKNISAGVNIGTDSSDGPHGVTDLA